MGDNQSGKKILHNLSTYSKIFIQAIFFIAVVFAPNLFPSIIFPNHFQIVLNLFLALTTSIVFEAIVRMLEDKNRSTRTVLNIQMITSVILLTHFLYFFYRINGPLFILYGLTLMESSLNLSIKLATVVVGIMMSATIIEWGWLIYIKEIAVSLTNIIFVIIRILFLFLMANYSRSLAKTILSERELRFNAQKLSIKLESANIQLRELDKLKDEFVSVASHELRTPMTAIKSYLWLAINKPGQVLSEQLTKYLNIAYNSTERLIHLVQNMLTISRIEGKRLQININKIKLNSLIKEIYDELKIQAEQKQINFTFNTVPYDISINADQEKIEEALQNIIGNALKFTPNKGKVTIYLKDKQNTVEVSVSDTGPGISKESQTKLFQKFGQVENSPYVKSNQAAGTGLGLYITKQILVLHHGNIWIESQPGKGATFIFSLPKNND